MIFRPPLLIALLSASATWATQTPMGASSNEGGCLSISGGSPKATYDACCSGGSTTGKGSVDGVEFTYSCGKWASPYQKTSITAATARECARLCAGNPDCPASSWTSRGQCFFVTTKSYSISSTSGFLLLENTGVWTEEPEPEGGCGKPVEAAKAQCAKDAAAKCEAEKSALSQGKDAECEKEVKEKCSGDAAVALEQQKAKCEQEKSADTRLCDESKKKAEAQCQVEKAGLLDDAKRQCEAAKTQLEAEKQALQKALDEANQKLNEKEKEKVKGDGSGELSGVTRGQLCPGYGDREFETTNSDGSRNKWRVRCNTMLNRGAWVPDNLHYCQSNSILDLLKERQEQKASYLGLWFNAYGQCNHVHSGLVVPLVKALDASMTHHYIERIG